MCWLHKKDGFSLVEIVMVCGIMLLLVGMTILNIKNRQQQDKEDELKSRLIELRNAVQNYYLDHNHFPGSKEDFNRAGDVELLKRQLLWYTDFAGRPSMTRSREFRFGPYLQFFPTESITGKSGIVMDTNLSKNLLELKQRVAESLQARGGWFYQSATGTWLVNLNQKEFKDYYAFF